MRVDYQLPHVCCCRGMHGRRHEHLRSLKWEAVTVCKVVSCDDDDPSPEAHRFCIALALIVRDLNPHTLMQSPHIRGEIGFIVLLAC
jgi:hypothetical protein